MINPGLYVPIEIAKDLKEENKILRGALESIKANSHPDAVSLSPPTRIMAFHQIAVDALAIEVAD